MKLVLLSGSFRSKSRSAGLLNEIKSFFPEHDYDFPRLDLLPFYNEDSRENKPECVEQLIDQISIADGVIVCTPEYNHSIPAVLKNGIDWASRPAFNSVLKSKPVTIITQADSPVGGARVQAHVKLIFDSTLSFIHPCHEMLIPEVGRMLDEELRIIDANIERRLKRHVSDFLDFIQNGP